MGNFKEIEIAYIIGGAFSNIARRVDFRCNEPPFRIQPYQTGALRTVLAVHALPLDAVRLPLEGQAS